MRAREFIPNFSPEEQAYWLNTWRERPVSQELGNKPKPKKTPPPDSSKRVSEKWSKRYKRSINCKNPKGFSQRAHCQGRKK